MAVFLQVWRASAAALAPGRGRAGCALDTASHQRHLCNRLRAPPCGARAAEHGAGGQEHRLERSCGRVDVGAAVMVMIVLHAAVVW
jgi:hypothetical protein